LYLMGDKGGRVNQREGGERRGTEGKRGGGTKRGGYEENAGGGKGKILRNTSPRLAIIALGS